MKFSYIFLQALCAGLFVVVTAASANPAPSKKELGAFFNVKPDRLFIECASKDFQLTDATDGPVLSMCLSKNDKKRRCEIAVHDISRTPAPFNVNFDVMSDSLNTASTEEFSIMQLHSYPDKGESWRCPVMSLEVKDSTLRLFNRWDKEKLSKGAGYNCAGAGSTITSRVLFQNMPVENDRWHHMNISGVLSYDPMGEVKASLDDRVLADTSGATTYNDRRPPFLKFGIYKPTSWRKSQPKICMHYKNVQIGG